MDVCHITLNGSAICFVDELKYLAWYVVLAKCFKISMHQIRVKFFQSFNSIYARSSHFLGILLMLTVSHTCYMDLKSLHGIVVNCLI